MLQETSCLILYTIFYGDVSKVCWIIAVLSVQPLASAFLFRLVVLLVKDVPIWRTRDYEFHFTFGQSFQRLRCVATDDSLLCIRKKRFVNFHLKPGW